eukprot:CAMPEP_0119044374 /NCGR_PEP_ID=MMETSP1177-20130426/30996_1 /TAXON_ID=2985 /ORGANISM="Ochromonas sp, Strain CCMP1899" /LENGTH=418 /DNA_ID=CAMNT_0007014415 /DNA_START=136 /DNA_END=1392 /DNA_ORIENTATION=-
MVPNSKEEFFKSILLRRSKTGPIDNNNSSLIIKNISRGSSNNSDEVCIFRASLKPDEADVSQKIHDFVREIYRSVCGFEVLDNVLMNQSGAEALLTFLKQEYCEEFLQFYMDVEAARMGKIINVSNLNTRHLLDTYLMDASPHELNLSCDLKAHLIKLFSDRDMGINLKIDSMELGERKSLDSYKGDVQGSLECAQQEIRDFLALGAIPRFFTSTIFHKWRDNEIKKENPIFTKTFFNGYDENLEKNDDVYIDKESIEALDSLLEGNAWLKTLLYTFEDVPVCISVAAALRSTPGFPLIYVNKAFEKTTGYPRYEIIGKNCRFLQEGQEGEQAEPEIIKRLTTALARGQPVKVLITNYRKDGTPFKNLLAVKPIYNERGDYAFVIGMQFDTNSADATAEKLQMLNKFLTLIPDTVLGT